MPFPNDIRDNFTSLITGRSGLYFKDHDLKNLENSMPARMEALKLSARQVKC